MKLQVAVLLFGAVVLSSCGTVHPASVDSSLPGIAGNNTSGMEDIQSGGTYVTAEWVQNYNQGIEDYGNDPFFKHHLVKNEGVTIQADGRFFATDEAHHNYGMFAKWRRAQTHKPKTLLQKAGIS